MPYAMLFYYARLRGYAMLRYISIELIRYAAIKSAGSALLIRYLPRYLYATVYATAILPPSTAALPQRQPTMLHISPLLLQRAPLSCCCCCAAVGDNIALIYAILLMPRAVDCRR